MNYMRPILKKLESIFSTSYVKKFQVKMYVLLIKKQGETTAIRSNEFQKRKNKFPDAQVVIVSISGHGYEAPVHAQPHYEPQYAAPIQEQYAPPTVQQQYVPPATVQQQYVPPTVQHQAPQPQHHQQLVDPYEVPIFKVKVARDGEANP
jgi:hypothetical protein